MLGAVAGPEPMLGAPGDDDEDDDAGCGGRLAAVRLAAECGARAGRLSEGCGFADRAGASTVTGGRASGLAGAATAAGADDV
jgi:hypothetical protein